MTLLFFFFKQKTAYEMRISDWSSDVCSSDLGAWNDRQSRTEKNPPCDASSDRVRGLPCCDRRDGSGRRMAWERRAPSRLSPTSHHKIGRASCRERVCQYV